MGKYQDSTLQAWKSVNAAAASLHLTGAAPAFRQAIAQTDFASLVPAWEFGQFRVYVLDWLDGNMVYVEQAGKMAVVGRYLWTVMSCDYSVLDVFVDDLTSGASGVKIIDYNHGPYRKAGQAWAKMNKDLTVPVVDPLEGLEAELTKILERVHAIRDNGTGRVSEQYQVLFNELDAASDTYEALQARLGRIGATLDVVREAVADV